MDARFAVWVAAHRVHALDQLFVGLGTVEKLGLLWIVVALVVGWARGCGVWGTATFTLAAALATFAADSAAFGIKDLTSRTRPFVAHPQIHPLYVVHSSSFPAGHAATAFAGAVLVAAVVRATAPVVFTVAAAIGFSRVYCGVHYATDVLAGALLGALVGAAAFVVLRLLRSRIRPVGRVLDGRPVAA